MDKENLIEKYCREQGFKLAHKIDDGMAVVIKPKPRWLPKWLYKRIIKETIELTQVN